MEKRISAFDVRRGFGQIKQWSQTRERFFATLAAGQAAAGLSEEDAAQLAAEAVQAVRSGHSSGR